MKEFGSVGARKRQRQDKGLIPTPSCFDLFRPLPTTQSEGTLWVVGRGVRAGADFT